MSARPTKVYRWGFGGQHRLEAVPVNWWKPVGCLT